MQACHLSASNLACRRGDRLLFRGLDLALQGGDALHVAGPNGIGKTSLLRILAGLLRPFAGVVARTGTIALLDEKPALDPQVPLAAALAFWADLDGVGSPVRESCAERAGLAHLGDVPVRYLSTGQRKRAALARMHSQNAPIWLLDEPLNGLDAEGVKLAEALVSEHLSCGGIAVVASHQPMVLPTARTIELAAFIP